MTVSREMATAFVEGYGRTWESWDFDGFVELFSDEVIYVEHPVDETVVGREAIGRYIRREQAEAGTVSVRMGRPIVEGHQVVAEFWTTMSNREGEPEGTLIGCFIAQLDPTTGRCTHFRQYWLEVEGHAESFSGWGK
jgi:SnoaL-like domain